MSENILLINYSDPILITGSNGFIGSRVVKILLEYGFRNLNCSVRPSSNLVELNRIIVAYPRAHVRVIKGNLQSGDHCKKISDKVSAIYHLAAGRGEKSYPDAFMNTVVTTRNLLDTITQISGLKRFVNVSSFSVYSNRKIKSGGLLDESCDIENHPDKTGEAYCYAKVKQEELVVEYGRRFNIPYVIVRPGVVYGPGNKGLTGRVGIDTFGVYLHLGGSNKIPLSYVDNCAEAIVMAGLKKGVDGEIFNIVDDDLPTSRNFLKMYKKNVKRFRSLYVPHSVSYFLCYLWEKYYKWSEGQLPLVFNRIRWSNYWKGNEYSNEKLKSLIGWSPRVGFKEASRQYFEYQKQTRKIND